MNVLAHESLDAAEVALPTLSAGAHFADSASSLAAECRAFAGCQAQELQTS